MAPPSPKRRKLSPEGSVRQNIPDTPSRISTQDRTTPSRPSYASPTKASIAKHNPQSLSLSREQASSTQAEIIPANAGNTPQAPTAESANATRPGETDVEKTTTSISGQNPPEAARQDLAPVVPPVDVDQSTTQSQNASSLGGGLSARPRRKSRTPGRNTQEPAVPATAAAGKQPESVNEPAPDPFQRQGLRRSPIIAAHPDADAQASRKVQEPELPPTPIQRGLADPIVTTPPSGIHDTPSKRPRRRKGRKMKPSPLKSRQKAPVEQEAETEKDTEPQVEPDRESRYPRRPVDPVDPYAGKRKLRDRLLAEKEQLLADLVLAEEENERIRQLQTSKDARFERSSNHEEILSLLLRSTVEPAVPKEEKPASIFQTIIAFLPFSKRPRGPAPSPKSTTPLSHLPVPLDNPLPYLQVFSPLTFSSTTALLSQHSPVSKPTVLQQHNITAAAPSGLFFAHLLMLVNVSTLSVSSVSITRLHPCAEAELGPWLRERASGKGLLGKDISAICWAMARWYEIALDRAKFWCAVIEEMGTAEGRAKVAQKMEKSGKRKRGGEAHVMAADTTSDETDEGGGLDAGQTRGHKLTRKQLLLNMKRTSLDLESEHIRLRIDWRIGIDWIGEAESTISASAQVPSSWKEQDERVSLAKVPATFDALVKSKGPMPAVKTIVTLLMPT
ncbi:MAG: hypothetical protein M1818_000431 [Claussenomyces sp. TS43310]|nr:MAG: hypothetical protein M1818_000431 [Claussenomyces sp. TS43310]